MDKVYHKNNKIIVRVIMSKKGTMCLWVPLLAFLAERAVAREIVKSITVSVIEEKANNTLFTHRIDIIDGHRKEIWAVEGKTVSFQDYEDAILNAEREERRQERLKEYERQREKEEFALEVQRNCLKKLLRLEKEKVESLLHKLSDQRLEQYFAFHEKTFPCLEVFEHISLELLPKVEQMIFDDQIGFEELRTMVLTLEKYPSSLQKFYNETITRAQEQSDDTRFLKDLLALVSEIS